MSRTANRLYAEHPVRGALLVMGAGLMFTTMGVFVKRAGADLPNAEVVFFRNLFGLVTLLPWLRGGLSALATRKYHLHVVRALAGLGAMYCYFYAIAHLPLAEAIVLNFTAPLFIPFVALLWLREPFPRHLVLAILLGFAGVVLVMRPGVAVLSPAACLGLVSGALAAVALVGVRRMSGTEPTTRIVFFFAMHASLLSAFPVPAVWVTPQPAHWLLLFGAGLCATFGQLLLTRGYAHAPAAQVGPYHYTAVLFAAAYGWTLWGEVPDVWVGAGALLICAAGIIAARRTGLPVATMYSVVRRRNGSPSFPGALE